MTPNEVWYKAYAAEIGIKISVSDPTLAKRRLYAARKKLNDPSLAELSICIHPAEPNTFFILKRSALNAPQIS